MLLLPALGAVYAFANISGAHLNPAVTFALMCTGHMKWWKGLLYMVMQVRATATITLIDLCCRRRCAQLIWHARGGIIWFNT